LGGGVGGGGFFFGGVGSQTKKSPKGTSKVRCKARPEKTKGWGGREVKGRKWGWGGVLQRSFEKEHRKRGRTLFVTNYLGEVFGEN